MTQLPPSASEPNKRGLWHLQTAIAVAVAYQIGGGAPALHFWSFAGFLSFTLIFDRFSRKNDPVPVWLAILSGSFLLWQQERSDWAELAPSVVSTLAGLSFVFRPRDPTAPPLGTYLRRSGLALATLLFGGLSLRGVLSEAPVPHHWVAAPVIGFAVVQIVESGRNIKGQRVKAALGFIGSSLLLILALSLGGLLGIGRSAGVVDHIALGLALVACLSGLANIGRPTRSTNARAQVVFVALVAADVAIAFGLSQLVLSADGPQSLPLVLGCFGGLGVLLGAASIEITKMVTRDWSLYRSARLGAAIDQSRAATTAMDFPDVVDALLRPWISVLSKPKSEPALIFLDPEVTHVRNIGGVVTARGCPTWLTPVMRELVAEHRTFLVGRSNTRTPRDELARAELTQLGFAGLIGVKTPDGILEAILAIPASADPTFSIEPDNELALLRAVGDVAPRLRQGAQQLRHIEHLNQAHRTIANLENVVDGFKERVSQNTQQEIRLFGSFPLFSYSRAMRSFLHRLDDIWRARAATWIVVAPGIRMTPIYYRLFAAEKSLGALQVVDCAKPPAVNEDPMSWIENLGEGFLVLENAHCLDANTQEQIVQVLSSRTISAQRPFVGHLLFTSCEQPAVLHQRLVLIERLTRRVASSTLVHPTLNERPEDFSSLVHHLLEQHTKRRGITLSIAVEAVDVLRRGLWSGNESELDLWLDSAVNQAVTDGISRIEVNIAQQLLDASRHASGDPRVGETAPELGATWADIERNVIKQTLERAQGNKSEAARLLGLKRSTFLDKLKRSGLSDSELPQPLGN